MESMVIKKRAAKVLHMQMLRAAAIAVGLLSPEVNSKPDGCAGDAADCTGDYAADDACVDLKKDRRAAAECANPLCDCHVDCHVCDEEEVEPFDVSSMNDDVIYLLLSNLDGLSLPVARCVCRHWHNVGGAESLWEPLCRARWRLTAKKRGGYKYGEREWSQVYRKFHRHNRAPDMIDHGVSRHEVAFASGNRSRVAAWLLVSHNPACRLPAAPPAYDDALSSGVPDAVAGRRCLRVRVVVQNIRASPVRLTCLSVVLRGDPYRPRPIHCALPAREIAPLEAIVVDGSLDVSSSTMRHEPDAIEACETLIVRADDVATGAAAFVACPFVGESKMWQHYELVTRDFYVFHEIEELLP